ncbi:ecto-NOX disulfide-thiol exchanger 1-like, partial [Notothenia coriiceps]|uniref:Ecto-NOX disulfide-thiol exchanger 1-like n=1 Tax=Notothenia coriiceps TaxID=8208 RepID=A0A6I9N3L0_9TELE
MGIRREEEMEMSEDDSEESPCKRLRSELNGVCDPPSLKEENDSLRWQLDAYRNEVELLRNEHTPAHTHTHTHSAEAQIQLLQQNMLSMQQQLLVLQEKLSSKEAELQEAREERREERSSLQGEVRTLSSYIYIYITVTA